MRVVVVTIDVVKDSFTASQKRELIERITDAAVAVEGEPMRGFTWVRIVEVAPRDWGLGGEPVDADDLHRIAAAQAHRFPEQRTIPERTAS